MKLARLVCSVFAVTMVTGWATWSFACDKDKATAASAAHAAGACTAEMAAQCTPEMAAACKAKMSAASAAGCPGMEAKAKGKARGMRVTAAAIQTADMKGPNTAAIRTADMRGMNVVAASAAGHDACCASKASAASAKSAAGACATKGASAAGHCNGHGLGAMAAAGGHDDCEACLDMSSCSEALDAVRAHRQAVRLKNGVMYVYTADTQRDVSAVQAAVARRGDHMARLVSAGDKARLCAECKSMRGAMASGKLTREIVNIEGGSLTLITSTDPAMVAKIHAMADAKVAARGPKS